MNKLRKKGGGSRSSRKKGALAEGMLKTEGSIEGERGCQGGRGVRKDERSGTRKEKGILKDAERGEGGRKC